jgi:hypothetical protein
VPTTNPGASPEAMLITIGADQPEQEETIAEPRMNAPTRVNVANRHLGNKACFQETIVYSGKNQRAESPLKRALNSTDERNVGWGHQPNGCLYPQVKPYTLQPPTVQ